MKKLFYRVIGPSLRELDEAREKGTLVEFTNINEGLESKVQGLVMDCNESAKRSIMMLSFRIIKADHPWIKIDHDYPIEYNFETLKGEIDLSPKG